VNWNFIGYFSGVRTDINFFTLEPASNPGYARFDMAASYNITHSLAVTARVWNLFNKQYQDALGYPALGQTYTMGLRYTFAGRN
jgi:outer membrane cobalamin receptor